MRCLPWLSLAVLVGFALACGGGGGGGGSTSDQDGDVPAEELEYPIVHILEEFASFCDTWYEVKSVETPAMPYSVGDTVSVLISISEKMGDPWVTGLYYFDYARGADTPDWKGYIAIPPHDDQTSISDWTSTFEVRFTVGGSAGQRDIVIKALNSSLEVGDRYALIEYTCLDEQGEPGTAGSEGSSLPMVRYDTEPTVQILEEDAPQNENFRIGSVAGPAILPYDVGTTIWLRIRIPEDVKDDPAGFYYWDYPTGGILSDWDGFIPLPDPAPHPHSISPPRGYTEYRINFTPLGPAGARELILKAVDADDKVGRHYALIEYVCE